MRNIQARFDKESERKENEYLSSFIIFAKAIRGQKLSKKSIASNLRNLVDKDDYEGVKMKELLDWLFDLSNGDEK